jgi:beta-glucosidase
VLRTKFDLGLFDDPYVDVGAAATAFDTSRHRALARHMAGQSLVLLRNDGMLPLAGDTGSLGVIGPNADVARHLLGDYTYPAHIEALLEARDGPNPFSMPVHEGFAVDGAVVRATTVLAALRARFGTRVRFAAGCEVDSAVRDGFDEAVALAAASDVAVLVMGDRSGVTADCTSGESRDRATLDLPGVQEELAEAVLATGTPVVLVLVAGRPVGSARLHERCAAVLMAWMPGQEGAEAIADVLTGEVNPGGKLPITFPRAAGQVPVYYGHKVSGGRSTWQGDYVDMPVQPLHPFGHGLSYTTFSLAGASVAPVEVSAAGEDITVEVSVTNTGDRAGDEVVQLYARRPRASVTRPVLELKGFVRVSLAAGEARTVSFRLPLGQLGFYDRTMAYVVEPGILDLLVGTSSHDLVEAGSVTIVADRVGRRPPKVFDGSVTVR